MKTICILAALLTITSAGCSIETAQPEALITKDTFYKAFGEARGDGQKLERVQRKAIFGLGKDLDFTLASGRTVAVDFDLLYRLCQSDNSHEIQLFISTGFLSQLIANNRFNDAHIISQRSIVTVSDVDTLISDMENKHGVTKNDITRLGKLAKERLSQLE